ncbi:MAG: fibronectin type III domain-containing protein [Candidatus Paceibacterota bacterium]
MNLTKNNNASPVFFLVALVLVLVVGVVLLSSPSDSLVLKSKNRSFLALPGEPLRGAPGAPENIAVRDNGDLSVRVSWDEPETSGDFPVSSYNVYYLTGKGKDVVEEVISVSDTSETITHLSGGTLYTLYITAVNATGEGALSDPYDFSVVAPSLLSVSEISASLKDNNTVNLSWSTNIDSLYSITYGPIGDRDQGKNVQKTKLPETRISTDIRNLSECSKYWYFITIENLIDARDIVEESGNFVTRGCKGDSNIISVASDSVTDEKSASLETNGGDRKIAVMAPSSLRDSSHNLFIQASKLEKQKVETAISAPSGKRWAGDNAYSIKAFDEDVTELNETFDKDVIVNIDYVEKDIEGLDIESLTIYPMKMEVVGCLYHLVKILFLAAKVR